MKLRQAEWSYKILQTVFTLSFDTLLWYAYSLLKVRWPLKGTWIYYQYKGWPEIRIRPEMWLVQTGLLVQQSKAGSGSQQQVIRSCVIVCVCVYMCVCYTHFKPHTLRRGWPVTLVRHVFQLGFSCPHHWNVWLSSHETAACHGPVPKERPSVCGSAPTSFWITYIQRWDYHNVRVT